MAYDNWLGAYRLIASGSSDACRRVIFVGENNPQTVDPRFALHPRPRGVAGHRLHEKILGVRASTLLSTWRANVCDPSQPKWVHRNLARCLLDQDAEWRVVVMLGRKVADAFRFNGDAFDQETVAGFTLALMPHPSGRCRTWNDASAICQARELMRSIAPLYPIGEAD